MDDTDTDSDRRTRRRARTDLTFDALGVSARLVKVLADQGITEPFPIQRLTIADALAGRDVCGKAKTGSGKTLAFGLPAPRAARPRPSPASPAASCSCPPASWPLQVHDVLAPLGRGHRQPGRRRLRRRRHGQAGQGAGRRRRGVVATPGRLIDLVDRKEVELDDLEIVVVDEADRMADMGFLPQVEWLLRHVDGRAPDAAVLGHARRRRRRADQALPARPRVPRGRVAPRSPSTR